MQCLHPGRKRGLHTPKGAITLFEPCVTTYYNGAAPKIRALLRFFGASLGAFVGAGLLCSAHEPIGSGKVNRQAF
jgi:hypothetical protein